MLAFLYRRLFLIALVAVLLGGMNWPVTLEPVADWLPGNALVALVTFIMALPLETSALWRAIRRPGPAWLASAINGGIAPPLGWLASRVLPLELAAGVILACTVPCTLATAAVWTRRAGGNDAIAFLVTAITNLSCFIVVPAWLVVLLGVHAGVDIGGIAYSLVVMVVLPILAAQALRQWRAIGAWATTHKKGLSRIAQFGVLLMVFSSAVKCGRQLQALPSDSAVTPSSIVAMTGVVTAVHVLLLLLGASASRALGIPRGDAIAVAFSGSQKTLVVGAYLAKSIGPLAILPMVAYHAVQLVLDTIIADRLNSEK
jgi:solute carrier family 10 (sodium/bile acid cotransporter), member 7